MEIFFLYKKNISLCVLFFCNFFDFKKWQKSVIFVKKHEKMRKKGLGPPWGPCFLQKNEQLEVPYIALTSRQIRAFFLKMALWRPFLA